DGAPPSAAPTTERWVPPDENAVPDAAARAQPPRSEPSDDGAGHGSVVAGTLRAPRLWEKLLVDAAVIGGRDRWERRIDGLARGMADEIASAEDPDDGAVL